MKRNIHTAALVVAASLCGVLATHAAEIEAYFSPRGGCAAAICRELAAAKTAIRIQAYSLSESTITAAIIDAHMRGVDVRLVVNKTQQSDRYSSAPKIRAAGVHIVTDPVEALQHNKVIIIDNATVITGSYNFSAAAENDNAENLIIIRNSTIAAAFSADWLKHYAHSTTYRVAHHRDFQQPPFPTDLLTPLNKGPQKEPRKWHVSPGR